MDAVETTSKTTQSMRGFVLLAVGFGCMIGYVRLVSLGFVGYLEQGVIESVDPYYNLRSVVTVVLLVVLALAGWFKWFKLNAMALMGATACAVAAAMLFAVDDSGAVLPAAAVLEGLASAVFMYAWMLVLSSQAVGTIVCACVAGGCLAGFIISVVPLFDDALGLIIAVATAFVSGSMLVLSDRGVDSLEPDGPLGRIEASRFPWISIVMVLSCGFLSTVVYGVAIRLAWLHAWSPNYFAFGLAIVATASATIVVMLKARNWIHVVWVPVTVLFVLALGFSCISVRESMQIALGLVLASVFCGFFLFWMIFAGMFSTVRAPRAALAGVVLVLANGSLATMIGSLLGSVLPRSMQNLGGVAGLAIIALVILFAVTLAVYRQLFGLDAFRRAQLNEVFESSDGLQSIVQEGAAVAESESAEETMLKRVENHAAEYGLTPREIEVAQLTAQGFSCAYIAEKLVVSNSTVRFHQQNIYRKFDVHSRNELIELFLKDMPVEQG